MLPRDKEFEYLPTQAVSEYLAEQIEPRLDGIVFHSSQTAGQGRNVVLFNHACGVLPYELPEGSEIRINMGGGSEDDLDDRIAVFETVPVESAEEGSEAASADLLPSRRTTPKPILLKNDASEFGMHGDPTLKLDVDSIRVLLVRGVHYEYDVRKVGRHRIATSENESETV